MKEKGVGRPRQFKFVKAAATIRIPENILAQIKEKHGSIQRWIDSIIKRRK